MPAHDATLTEALTLLRGPSAAVTQNILRDDAVLWVGSRISASKFLPLRDLLLLLLKELHRAQDTSKSDCPYRHVSTEIVRMTTYRNDREIDVFQSPDNWPFSKLNGLLEQLQNQYADVLEIPLQRPSGHSLAWDFLDLQNKYGDPAVSPDAEHRMIALLVAEGAVSEIITTNWDALIERAHAALGCVPNVEVVACAQELNGLGDGALVFKIHGCAARMLLDPVKYRNYMVATRNDINNWTGGQFFQSFREKVRTLLRERPAVFAGISGQDFNLQTQFIEATIRGENHAFNPPRIAFTITNIEPPQRAILHAAYGETHACAPSDYRVPRFLAPCKGAPIPFWFLCSSVPRDASLALPPPKLRNEPNFVQNMLSIKY